MGSKRLTLSLTVALSFCVASAGCDDPSSPAPTTDVVLLQTEPVVVSHVTDGDTIRLRDGRRVRLVQIDAPESDECFGRAATRILARRLRPGARVSITADPTLDTVDEHGRFLRYVLQGFDNVNVQLVRDGAAVPYFFRRERGRFADDLLAAAGEARRKRRGLWAACPGAKLDPNRGSLTGPV